ncbi:unnamed protein product [Durusdinium trenchii]|uniref:Uncharacterized protein n=1 Tax=Durusdinium trenchii TaxID=1381693 RepID=A0ABP0MUP7_9DINO
MARLAAGCFWSCAAICWAVGLPAKGEKSSPEDCELEIEQSHQSLLQHATLVSTEKKQQSLVDSATAICDTVDTPPPSPLSDSMNNPGSFYYIALVNDTAFNPFSIKLVEKYNLRIRFHGGTGNMEAWWMENEDPATPWTYLNVSRHTTQPLGLGALFVDHLGCLKNHCTYSQWHAEIWKGYPLLIAWSCGGMVVGNEVYWAGGPSDPELIPYAWSLIQARGGGLERFPLTAVKSGPHDLPCRSEACEQNIQQSLLQHSTLLSKETHSPVTVDPLAGICDTVETPPYSPHADRINNGKFYVIALANDTLTNPVSYHYVEKYNFRIILEGRLGSFEAWWMDNDDPTTRWSYFDFSANSTQPDAVALKALDTELCKERHCQTLGGEFVLFALIPNYPGINFGG